MYEQTKKSRKVHTNNKITTQKIHNMTKAAGFSWKQDKLDNIDMKIRRAMTMAKNANNPDFKLKHPDWIRDAQKNDFTLLKKTVKEEVLKYQNRAQARRDKRSGKNQDK